VLYEMLTGKRAFDGSSPASVIAAILERPAPTIADIAPSALDRTLRRCLEKDPERRWQSASDLKAELEWIGSGGAAPAPITKVPRTGVWAPAIAAVLLIALGVALWAPWRRPTAVPSYTFSIGPGEGARFTGGPKISPDGTRVAIYSSGSDIGGIEIFRLDTGTSQRISGTPTATTISWSPDGRFLAFVQQLELKRVDVTGGPPIKIADFPAGNIAPFTAWGGQNVILYSGRDGMYAVSASGGQSRKVTPKPSTGPQFLPDGKHFLWWNNPGQQSPQRGTVYVGSIDAAPEQNAVVVLRDASAAVFAHDARGRGYLLFVRDDTLMAQGFDAAALKTVADPFVVSSQVGMMGPVPAVTASNAGTLVYTPDATGGRAIVQLAWFDRTGNRIGDAGQPGVFREFALSPDDSQVAVSLTERDSTNIYLMDAKSGASRPVRFTFERSIERSPIWSPDGSRVLFTRAALGLFEKPVNGAGPERLIIQPGERPTDWSRNGRTIVYSLGGHIMLFADGKPAQFTKTDFVEQFARLSPDGSLIAYTSNDSRHVWDVWVETVPARSKWQPSPDGGFQPRWSSAGRELFYIRYADATLMAVPVMPGPRFGPPVELFAIPTVGLDRGFAVSADGRFLIPTFASGASAPITVITNWTPSL